MTAQAHHSTKPTNWPTVHCERESARMQPSGKDASSCEIGDFLQTCNSQALWNCIQGFIRRLLVPRRDKREGCPEAYEQGKYQDSMPEVESEY